MSGLADSRSTIAGCERQVMRRSRRSQIIRVGPELAVLGRYDSQQDAEPLFI